MIILLVNDDGIKAKRLDYTKRILSEFGTVYTVAPSTEQSGKSMSITIKGFQFRKIDSYTWAVNGTPADCISFALYGLGLKPDIVVSGINRGYNIGIDTSYSGTVGAALQACFHGQKAIALSGDYSGDKNIRKYFKSTLKSILDQNMVSNEYILNINFPKDIYIEDKGIMLTKRHILKMSLRGSVENSRFNTQRKIPPQDIPEDSDVYAFRNGYISISKLYL